MAPKYVCIFLLLVALCACKPLRQAKIVKAVNCGLKEGFTKSEDIKYESVKAKHISGHQPG